MDYDSTDTDTDSNILTALGRNLRAARLAAGRLPSKSPRLPSRVHGPVAEGARNRSERS